MTSLIVSLSVGKGTWMEATKVINAAQWDKVYLITNTFGKEKYTLQKPHEFIVIDPEKPVTELSEQIRSSLQGKINDLEVAVNIISGTGNEHMAILSAVLKLGLALRLVTVKDNQMVDV